MPYMPRAGTVVWETPPELFARLNAVHHFDVDVCATPENAKCEKYFTEEQDGLSQDWNTYKSLWCNPPYGSEIAKWVVKAYECKSKTVMLLPARTDVKWFHKYIYGNPRCAIEFLKGRLRFKNAEGFTGRAPFSSMLVVFNEVK